MMKITLKIVKQCSLIKNNISPIYLDFKLKGYRIKSISPMYISLKYFNEDALLFLEQTLNKGSVASACKHLNRKKISLIYSVITICADCKEEVL